MTWIIENWRSLALVVLASLIAAIAYQAGSDHVQKRWDEQKLVHAQELIIANAKALAIERKSQETLAQKQKELEDEKRKTEILMAGADSRLDGLQNTVNRLKAQLSNSPSGSSQSNEAIAGSWDLLADCAGKYTAMGKTADIQRNQLAEWQAYGETINQFREEVKKLENVKENLM